MFYVLSISLSATETSYDGTADFDPGAGTVSKDGATDGYDFVWKLDSSGALVWVKATNWTAWDVAVDSSDNILRALIEITLPSSFADGARSSIRL